MQITAPIAAALGGSLGGTTGGTTGTGGLFSGLFAPTHAGYGPGDTMTAGRYVHPTYFDHAPRFHSGIGPGERPAILRTDKSVLTPGQMRAFGSGAGTPPKIEVTMKMDFTGHMTKQRRGGGRRGCG